MVHAILEVWAELDQDELNGLKLLMLKMLSIFVQGSICYGMPVIYDWQGRILLSHQYTFGCAHFEQGLSLQGVMSDQADIDWINFLSGRWSVKWKEA